MHYEMHKNENPNNSNGNIKKQVNAPSGGSSRSRETKHPPTPESWTNDARAPAARLPISPARSPPHDVTASLKVQWRYWTITAIASGDHIYIMWLWSTGARPAGRRDSFSVGAARERRPLDPDK